MKVNMNRTQSYNQTIHTHQLLKCLKFLFCIRRESSSLELNQTANSQIPRGQGEDLEQKGKPPAFLSSSF